MRATQRRRRSLCAPPAVPVSGHKHDHRASYRTDGAGDEIIRGNSEHPEAERTKECTDDAEGDIRRNPEGMACHELFSQPSGNSADCYYQDDCREVHPTPRNVDCDRTTPVVVDLFPSSTRDAAV